MWSQNVEHIIASFPSRGIFLTGIESSDPWVSNNRRNQLVEAHNFHEHWEKRIENIYDLGIRWLRFGPPYSQTHVGKDVYDFSLTEKVLAKCKELGIEVMVDLLHFGLPEWLHENNPHETFFQNNGFPIEYAVYVGHFVRNFPHIKYFTLINEPFVTANFSTKFGIWNEGHRSAWNEDKLFMNAIKNIARAAILAKEEIERIWEKDNKEGQPIFIQNESFEVAIAEDTAGHRMPEVNAFNLRRFAALDLIFGHRDETMKAYMNQHNLPDIDYEWCMEHGNTRNTVLGIDHYPTNIHRYKEKIIVDERHDAPFRLADLVVIYWDRYHLPMLHTETNAWPDHALDMCKKTYEVINTLRELGYPVLGMGWYGDEYMVGWHYALHGPLSHEESPTGLFYKGEIQPVGTLFGSLAKKGFDPMIGA
ncbi:MAG: family 1 glycosylhydrolase [bacterium]|nr:family 1 glycosylhydrolase [bacterium]